MDRPWGAATGRARSACSAARVARRRRARRPRVPSSILRASVSCPCCQARRAASRGGPVWSGQPVQGGRHVARCGVGDDEVPPLPHHGQVRGQARPLGTRPQAILGGQFGQAPAVLLRLAERVRLGCEHRLVQQVARSGQPPAVSHGSGVYENGRNQYRYPGSRENHSPGIRPALTRRTECSLLAHHR